MSDWNLYLLLSQMLGATDLEESVCTANEKNCWPQLLSLSSHQMVTTQLYWLLKSAPSAWQQIDSDAQQYLTQIFELNAERNTQLVNEAKHILSALNQESIVPLLLKGTGLLLSEQYPHMAYRMQLDTDFLVRQTELDKAASIIKKNGYDYAEETRDGLGIASENRIPRLLRIYQQHKHLPPLMGPGKRVIMELHRHPYSKRFQKYFPVSGIFERAITRKLDGLIWLEMSAQDQQHLLLIEGYIDAGFKRAYQLPLRLGRDFLDLQTLQETNNDKIALGKKLRHKQEFPQALIKALFLKPDRRTPDAELGAYIQSMERVMENRLLHKITDLHANFIRRAINLAHNPGLIRRLF